jgi:hypothetical protein
MLVATVVKNVEKKKYIYWENLVLCLESSEFQLLSTVRIQKKDGRKLGQFLPGHNPPPPPLPPPAPVHEYIHLSLIELVSS